MKKKSIEERFWSKVNKTDNVNDCWNWLASGRSKFGYGTIKFKEKLIDSHRLSWMMANNEFNLTPKDFICHKCDNPKCVNPNHLFLGNASINMKDAFIKGRLILPDSEKYQFKLKHNPKNKSITNEKMKEIITFIEENKNLSLKRVSEIFNISYQMLKDSRRKKKRSFYNIN